MSLTPFLNRHDGETAWLFGKGPGLDSFDLSTAGPLRAAINDVAGVVPDVSYCFANDDVRKWADVYQEGQTLFQPARILTKWHPDGRVACSVVTYADDWRDDLADQSRESLAECLHVRRGTLGSALQVLHVMGVSRVIAVGIDGGNAHASGHAWRTRLRLDHWRDYNAIRADAIRIADQTGIDLQFYQPHDFMNDGKITVKLLRNCHADGESLKAGKVYSLNPSTAYNLLAIRRAERVEDTAPPTPPPIEKAVAEPVEKETATAPRAKKKTARKRAH